MVLILRFKQLLLDTRRLTDCICRGVLVRIAQLSHMIDLGDTGVQNIENAGGFS